MLFVIKRVMYIFKLIGIFRLFVIIMDGYISVEQEVFFYICQYFGKVNFFVLGIGLLVNCYFIEGIVYIVMSEFFVVIKKEDRIFIVKKFV